MKPLGYTYTHVNISASSALEERMLLHRRVCVCACAVSSEQCYIVNHGELKHLFSKNRKDCALCGSSWCDYLYVVDIWRLGVGIVVCCSHKSEGCNFLFLVEEILLNIDKKIRIQNIYIAVFEFWMFFVTEIMKLESKCLLPCRHAVQTLNVESDVSTSDLLTFLLSGKSKQGRLVGLMESSNLMLPRRFGTTLWRRSVSCSCLRFPVRHGCLKCSSEAQMLLSCIAWSEPESAFNVELLHWTEHKKINCPSESEGNDQSYLSRVHFPSAFWFNGSFWNM